MNFQEIGDELNKDLIDLAKKYTEKMTRSNSLLSIMCMTCSIGIINRDLSEEQILKNVKECIDLTNDYLKTKKNPM